jgi:hypothetical protein
MTTEIKNFEFGGKAAGPESIGEFAITIKSTGEKHTFRVRELKDTHVAYLVRAAQRKRNESAIISAVINFMEHAMVAESADRFEDLVLGDPGLELMEVVQVFQHVLGLVSDGTAEASVEKKAPRRRSGNPALRSAV